MHDGISVVITTFNSSNFIEKTLNSVFDQSLKVKKIFIIDDNSSDLDKLKIITRNFNEKKEVKITLISNKENLGPGHSRNIGWSKCQTKYIAFLDDDDYWYQDKLKYQLDIFKKKKTIKLVAAKKKSSNKLLNINMSFDLKLIKLSFVKLLFKNSIATSSVVLRTDIKDRFLNEFYAEDYYLWLSILKKKYECYLINEYLCSEIYTNKKTKLSRDNLNMQRGVQNVLNKFYNKSLVNNMLVNFVKFYHYLKNVLKIIYK